MNRHRCANCPHKAYFHDDRADLVGECQAEGCTCTQFVKAAP